VNDATRRSAFSPRNEKAGFPDRTNPGRTPKALEAGREPTRRADASYPAKCDPRKPRTPLNDDQQGLTVRYLPLAQALARRAAQACPAGRDEFESAALLALVEAAQSFDPSRKVDFATFARHRIRGALLNAQRELFSFTRRCRAENAPRFQPLEHDSEVRGQVVASGVASPVGADLEAADAVENWLRKLPAMQSAAFRHIYLDGKTQEEAAALVGCSRSAMSRIHQETITWFHQAGWAPATPTATTAVRGKRAESGLPATAPFPSDARDRLPSPRPSRSKPSASRRPCVAAAG
jgi:RNA polymerase sigma factor (sigma-70 family)